MRKYTHTRNTISVVRSPAKVEPRDLVNLGEFVLLADTRERSSWVRRRSQESPRMAESVALSGVINFRANRDKLARAFVKFMVNSFEESLENYIVCCYRLTG